MAQKEIDTLQNLMLQIRLYSEGSPWKATNRLWSWLVVASSYLLDAASGLLVSWPTREVVRLLLLVLARSVDCGAMTETTSVHCSDDK